MTIALIVLTALYVRGWRHLWKTLPKLISVWRLAAFAGGTLSLWAAHNSPLAELDEQLLTVHMLQHLLLMTVAAPLILLGAPCITLLHGLPRPFVRIALGPVMRSRAVHWLSGMATQPAFCWFAASLAVIGWHVPAAFNLALRAELWHVIEHACFLTAGLLFWWPVIQPWPSAARLPRWSVPLYLFLATLPCDALAAYLVFCDHVVYAPYLSVSRTFALTPIEDQALAGALMWVWVTFAYLLPALVVTVQMLSGARGVASEMVVNEDTL
jgi:putative membrane protein